MRAEQLLQHWEKEYNLPPDVTKEQLLQLWGMLLPPYSVKVEAVKQYGDQFNLRTLIETGTCYGDMVLAAISHFDRIISIEVFEPLYLAAKHKFSRFYHTTIIHGDSGKLLPRILESVSDPCLFWLDGHYVPGTIESAKGDLDTPIMQELECILDHRIQDHVILIDDARCFIGPNPVLRDYPTIAELRSFVMTKRADLVFEVKQDIIRIHKK